MPFRILSFTIIIAVSCLCDAGAFWPVFHGNNQHNGLTVESGPSNPVIKWRFKGEGIFMYHSPVVAKDGTIYLLKGTGDYLTGNDAIYALTKEGKLKWKHARRDLRFSPPVVYGDTVFAVATIGKAKTGSYLTAIDSKEGKLKWELPLSEHYTEPWVSHIVVDSRGRIYARAGDALGAFSLSGEKIWVYRTWSGGRASQGRGPTLSPDEKTLYFHVPDERGLMAFDVETGKIRWKDAVAYYNEWSSPVVGLDGTVYITDSNTESLYAIKPDGRHKWKVGFEGEYVASGMVAASNDGKTIYMTTESRQSVPFAGNLYALDRDSGKIKWRYRLERGVLVSPPAVDRSGKIYVGMGDGYVYSFNPEGALLWKILAGYEVEKSRELESGDHLTQIYMSASVLSDGNLYIVTGRRSDSGELVAIGSR